MKWKYNNIIDLCIFNIECRILLFDSDYFCLSFDLKNVVFVVNFNLVVDMFFVVVKGLIDYDY